MKMRKWEDLDPATQEQIERLQKYMEMWGYESTWGKFEAIKNVLNVEIRSFGELRQWEIKRLLDLYGDR